MKSVTGNASTSTKQAMARPTETVGERGPVPLTEAELVCVAAAGGKKGVSGGSTV